MALVPNKEVLQNIQTGKEDGLSTCFKNMTDAAFEYAMSNDSQQLETTKGSLFGAYNAVTGYFQNVRAYKNEEAKLKSFCWEALPKCGRRKRSTSAKSFQIPGSSFLTIRFLKGAG